MAISFESQTCGRCGGSGRYSFNQMNGDRCFGCGGTGYKLTKRGAAAKAFYTAKLERPAGEVVVGDYVLETIGMFGPFRWLKVEEIAPDPLNDGYITLKLTRGGKCVYIGIRQVSPVKTIKTEEQRLGYLAEALAYQDTLTKVGKPAKRLAKAA